MDVWDQEAVETMGPGLLRLGPDGLGEINFICVEGALDCHLVERDGRKGVEFSWEGADEGAARSGRGGLDPLPWTSYERRIRCPE